MAREYVFLHEWDADAPQEAVFNALADVVWTLSPTGDEKVHIRFDWTVFADRWFLKLLTPVAPPLPLQPRLVGGALPRGARALRAGPGRPELSPPG